MGCGTCPTFTGLNVWTSILLYTCSANYILIIHVNFLKPEYKPHSFCEKLKVCDFVFIIGLMGTTKVPFTIDCDYDGGDMLYIIGRIYISYQYIL